MRGREQGGARPIVVLSHEIFNSRSGTIIAMAVTSQPQRAGYPLTWKVPAGRLPKDSWVKTSQIRTLSSERLGSRLAVLEGVEVDQLLEGLLQLIG